LMNILNRVVAVLMLTLTTLSCASSLSHEPSLTPLELRKLEICDNLQGFCWNYRVCIKKFLGICLKHELKTYTIEVKFKKTDEAKTLHDMNFILQVREKPL
jgi:hypothetical protein